MYVTYLKFGKRVIFFNHIYTAIWGEWGTWNSCVKTCGDVTAIGMSRARECVDPTRCDEEQPPSESQDCGQCRKLLLHIFYESNSMTNISEACLLARRCRL